MGGLKEGSDLSTFVGVYDGKLEVRVSKDTPGAITREKTKQGKSTGEVIHVKYYKSLEGRVKDIKYDKKTLPDGTEFTSLKIFVDDIGDSYVINWPYDSGLTSAFFHMMENIDFSQTVEFSVGKSKGKDGKERTALFIKQNGQNIKWKYTKDYVYAPGEKRKPEWEEKEFKGKKVWDNINEVRFFEAILRDKILPLLRSQPKTGAIAASKTVDDDWIPSGPTPLVSDAEVVNDDIPF